MADAASAQTTQFGADATIEDVMAALAHKSIFDLPTLAKELLKTAEEKAGEEDDPVVWDFFIHSTYALQHVGSPHVTDDGSEGTEAGVEPLK